MVFRVAGGAAHRVVAVISATLFVTAYLCVEAWGQDVPEGFTVEVIEAEPADRALGFTFLPDGRILVISHQSGEVRLLADGENNLMGTIPNLAISSERGLLGVAVDPDWPGANFLYLFYSSDTGVNRVSKFRVNGDVNDPTSSDLTLDLSSEAILLAMTDDREHHNAGTLRFGSDKMLYVSHGDDLKYLPEEDPYLQDLTNPYGKILRIRRDGTAPDDNPTFPESPDARLPEIFAIGLRNPFRFAIDPLTDRLFIGDVGTNVREEFNLSDGGENFGYPRHEGTSFFRENYRLIAPEPTPPVHDYAYERPTHMSAIAIATYRPVHYPDDASFPPAFDGVHFHADYFDNELRYLQPAESGWESALFGTGFGNLTDGAIGPDGSLYVLSYGGPLRKISYQPDVAAEEPVAHAGLELRQNHPNPFTDRTTVSYHVDLPGHVRLEVFDVLGRQIGTLVDGWQTAGVHAVPLEGDGLAAGTYICRLQSGGVVRTKAIVRAGR